MTTDWTRIGADLDAEGHASLPGLLMPEACAAVAALWDRPDAFRTDVDMARHGFGRGRYRYFADPLPEPVAGLRRDLYARLAPVANRWAGTLGEAARYPDDHAAFRVRCAAAGQPRPTPLLLRYGPGDHNRLHQDLYGETVFPFQVAILLDAPGRDFTGGEFVLTEQVPRAQSRVTVVPLEQGDGVVFAVRHRPVRGTRGAYRATLRHGVSTVRTGRRHVLGIIFHDAA